jgi:hypothetical protein
MTVDTSWGLSPSFQDISAPPLQHRLALVRGTHTGASNGQGRLSTVGPSSSRDGSSKACDVPYRTVRTSSEPWSRMLQLTTTPEYSVARTTSLVACSGR